jgi:hypothetical protein
MFHGDLLIGLSTDAAGAVSPGDGMIPKAGFGRISGMYQD